MLKDTVDELRAEGMRVGVLGITTYRPFPADEALRQGWQVPVDAAPTGKRVLVVGAGPSGLSSAYHLTRLGHTVTIKDAGAEPKQD